METLKQQNARLRQEVEKVKQEAKEMKRLIAEMTLAIRNEATTPEWLRGWREKASAYIGGQIVIHGQSA